MPIKELQRRLTQVGVIRLGGAKTDPKRPGPKLETLRFTSPSRPLIDAVAAKYQGEVKRWQSPTGPEWEVITQAREIQVLVTPQRIDPNYEQWGNGFRNRMCDGETERIRNEACHCAKVFAATGRRECKPTTRMSLMLAEIPSLGTWKLESHGWNAASELPMLAESIANAPQPIPARLEIQKRQKKVLDPRKPEGKQIETRNYMVPVLHFDFVTPAQAFGGQIGAAAQHALDTQHQTAITAAPSSGPVDDEKLAPAEVIRLARFVKSVPQLQALWKDAARDGALTDEVKAALEARAADLKPTEPVVAAAAPPTEAPTPPTAAVDDVVDVEVEPDKDALWMQILSVAGAAAWNTDALEERIYTRFKKPSDEINGWEMETFLAEAKAKGESA